MLLEIDMNKYMDGKTHHYCYIFIVDAVVVDRWFKEVGVRLEPE
jgi:hypothetical protein